MIAVIILKSKQCKFAIMQTNFFMYFCIKNYIGTHGEDLSTVKVL